VNWAQSTLARLRADFRLTLMSLFAGFMTLMLVPFTVYRFAQGQWAVGVMDSLILLFIVVPLIYAHRTGRTQGAAILQVVAISAGAVVAAYLLGRNGLLWAYPQLLANFFLVDRRLALGVNLVVIASIAAISARYQEGSALIAFAATATLVSLYAFIFAYRSDLQRKQLETLASYDALTGAGNRRLLERELEAEVRQFERWPRPVSLAVLDLDHFKQVNDRFGHEAGDRVLAEFAQIVGGSLRRLDRLYRLGGEEFVLLLPVTPPAGLPTVLEKLQECLHEQLRGPDSVVTVSMGAASLHVGESWAQWLARADAALYRAKHAGRDRFEIDIDPSAHTGSVQVQAQRRRSPAEHLRPSGIGH